MSVIRIVGGRELAGTVEVGGSKNATLAILSGVVLSSGKVVLRRVPQVRDVQIKAHLLEDIGASVSWDEDTLTIDCGGIRAGDVDAELVRSIRTSFYLLGPLVARLGSARLPQPGGCKIGARPVDFHVRGLKQLGAEIEYTAGYYSAKADRLVAGEIYLDFPSAGATQHLMASAVLAEGQTVIKNAAMEPEVVTLADFLNRIGARVEGAGTSTITVTGVTSLRGGEFFIPADRLQAGTLLLAGVATRGEVRVSDVLPEHQGALLSKLKEAGAHVEVGHNWISARGNPFLQAISIKTMPYPGFSTDMQQPTAAVLTCAHGVSTVEETIYESRIGHIDELNRMGAKIRLEGRTAVITGVDHLQGTVVEATDLRAGAALVIAGLAARGETIVKNVQHIDRGYENLEETLRCLGARVERIGATELEAATEWSG